MAKVLDSELPIIEKALIRELDEHIDYFKLVKKSLPPEIALTKKQYALLRKVQQRAVRHRYETYSKNIKVADDGTIEYRSVPIYPLLPKRKTYRRKDIESIF